MGFSIKRIFRAREKPDSQTEEIRSEEVTDQDVRDQYVDVCLRELAFWTIVSRIANALSMCEFRTFVRGKEEFGAEWYTWNFSPNKNQNKTQFIHQAVERLFRENELLIVESDDGQMFVADGYTQVESALFGDRFENVSVRSFSFKRSFTSDEVIFIKLNNRNVNQVLNAIYGSYAKLIDYTEKTFMRSRGNKGILEISAQAQNDKLFEDRLKKLLNDYFKTFFKSADAVLPLFEGYSYKGLDSKTYTNESSRDIKSQYDDIFDFTARGFSYPQTLAKGDVQDTSEAMNEMLTLCLDPLAERFRTEINRKKYGEDAVRSGTMLTIDTKWVKHIDMFDIAGNADKLISSGVATINMLLRAIGEPQIDETWANQHMMTKNYAGITDVLNDPKNSPQEGGENG